MAVKTIEQRICDVCGNAEDVTQYKVTYPKKWVWRFDLCKMDGAVLENLREAAKKQGTAEREREVSTVASVTESRRK